MDEQQHQLDTAHASSRRASFSFLSFFALGQPEPPAWVRVLLGLPLPVCALLLGSPIYHPVWFLFFPAVFLSGWLGGFVSGTVATTLSVLLVDRYVVGVHPSVPDVGSELAQQFVFVASGLLVSVVNQRLRAAARKLEAGRVAAEEQASQLQCTHRELVALQTRLRLALDSQDAGVWSLDLGSMRLDWDARVIELLRVPAEVVEQGTGIAYWEDHVRPADAELTRRRCAEAGNNPAPLHDVIVWRHDDGSELTLDVTSLAVLDGAQPRALVGTLRDITAEEAAARTLRVAMARLDVAREATGVGFWRWDLATDRIEWDRQIDAWFEVPGPVAAAGLKYAQWQQVVHREDMPMVAAAVARAMEQGTPQSVTYRIVLPSGRTRWLRSSGTGERDAGGRIVALLGLHQDVTEEVTREHVLRAREGEVQLLNRQLEDRVAERTAALLDALRHAEAAAHAKAAFLRNISHELRTPLNPILGFAYLLEESIKDPQQLDHLRHISSGGRRLLALVSNLIELSRANPGEVLDIEVDVAAIVEIARETYSAQAAEKGLELESRLDPQLPLELHGDPVRVAQVLMQLIGNAVKFSRRGRIVVSARLASLDPAAAVVRFEVQDEGIGIDAAHQSHVFDAFREAGTDAAIPTEGLGIGLALAKRAVEAMDGEIGVDSDVDRGSTFWFTVRFTRTRQAVRDEAEQRRSA